MAFPALGIVALAAIVAAVLHGPALAGLGLVGALATPLLAAQSAMKRILARVNVEIVKRTDRAKGCLVLRKR